ncbi:hypothetical protein P3W23_03055 [Luteibacter sp. PPL554]
MDTMLRKALAAGLDDDQLARLDETMSPRDAVVALLDAGDVTAALRLQMHLMPRGYLLPWLCECAGGARLSGSDARGLRWAERCLRSPDEHSRQAALDHAEREGFRSAGALIAACAGWADGHLVDSEGRSVPVGQHLCAAAATGALLMLAASRDAASLDDACAAFVRGGLELLSAEIVR